MTAKQELRQRLKALRSKLSAEEITEKSKIICARLFELVKGKSCVAAYLSAFNEVCVDSLINRLSADGVKIAVPITDVESGRITMTELNNIAAVSHGAYGIREPLEKNSIDRNEADAVIVPGVGFDRCGGRLGFGKGYYDKFLSGFKGLKIGVCYEFQLSEKICTEETDIPMDIIVTEMNCYVI